MVVKTVVERERQVAMVKGLKRYLDVCEHVANYTIC